MLKFAKYLIFAASCVGLLALVIFIFRATQANLLIALPSAVSAIYLVFLIGHWAITK